MYSQFIYFLVALTLYSLERPEKSPPYPGLITAILALGLFFSFVFITGYSFSVLKRRIRKGSVSARAYQALEFRLTTLALGFIAIYVYVLGIKYYIDLIPLTEDFITFSGVMALLLLWIHQVVIWYFGYRFHQFPGDAVLDRKSFVRENISFNLGILAPWFIISFFVDLVQLLLKTVHIPFLSTDIGHLFMIFALLILFACFGPSLIVRFWNCRPLPEGFHRQNIADFCREQDFQFREICLWPIFAGKVLTAGVIGFLRGWRYLLITESLLDVLSPEEIRGVVAHEMGHVRRHHLPLYLVLLIAYAVLIYLLWDAVFLFLLQIKPMAELVMLASQNPDVVAFVYSIPLLILLIFYFRYVFGYFMRNCERQADLYALEVIGRAQPLVSALEKIAYLSGNTRDVPSWHHFSIRERVEYLIKSEADRSFIRRHDKKLYASLLAFFITFGLLCWGGISFQGSSLEKRLRTRLELTWLQSQRARTSMDEARFSLAAGSLMLERGKIELAARFLERAVELDPYNADALNNLAWLYVTSKNKKFYHPRIGLKLAKKAASIKQAPYILDTLAEAYFANGQRAKAIETIKKALKLRPENRTYYLKQLKKFSNEGS